MYLIMFMLSFIVQDGWQYQRPQALLAAEANRRFRNAAIDWETEYLPSGTMGTGFARYAGDDYLLDHHSAERQSNVGVSRTHLKEMWQKGEFWQNTGGVLDCNVDTIAKFISVNPNSFGMTSGQFLHVKNLQDALWANKSKTPRMYKVGTDADLIVVQSRDTIREGTKDHKWWIDPTKGNSVVRCQTLLNDQVISESISQLEQYGDVWFPTVVAIYHGPREDSDTPHQIIRITSAEFNLPQAPVFGPEDVNVRVGTAIRMFVNGERVPGKELSNWRSWNDKTRQRLPWRKMVGMTRRGELDFGPEYTAQIAEARANTRTYPTTGHLCIAYT